MVTTPCRAKALRVTVATSVVQSASAPRAASSAARPEGEDNPPWTCPSCDVVIRASCYDKLKTAAWNHWCTRHVGEKMPQRCLFRNTVEPVVASPASLRINETGNVRLAGLGSQNLVVMPRRLALSSTDVRCTLACLASACMPNAGRTGRRCSTLGRVGERSLRNSKRCVTVVPL